MRQSIDYLSIAAFTVTVLAGTLAGHTLTTATSCTVQVNNQTPTLPYTLAIGDVLSVTPSAPPQPACLRVLAPDNGALAGGVSTVRLSATTAPTAGALIGGAGTRRNVGNGIVLNFTQATPAMVEGVLIRTTGLTLDVIEDMSLADSGGTVLTSGIGSKTLVDNGVDFSLRLSFARPVYIGPGSYIFGASGSAGASMVVGASQTLSGGATSLQINSRADGLTIGFTRGLGNVVGQLHQAAMRVVPTETAAPDWYEHAFEIVAPALAGSAPYLRFRHQGLDYTLPMNEPPPPGGGAS